MSSAAHPGAARTERLSADLRELGLDALLVERPVDLRYLTGFSGSNGLAIVFADESGSSPPHLFFTDFRYTSQSAEQVSPCFAREIVLGELLDAAIPHLGGRGGGRLAFDERSLTVARHRRIQQLLPNGWEAVAHAGLVERLRLVKEPGEVELMRAASGIADEALTELLAEGVVGRRERDLAIELELRMRRLGAQAPSFPSIVAAGAHAALPHAEPREQLIPADVLVTIDWGASYRGYCSDCTRTYATGEGISARAREVYALVLASQEQGLAAVRAGPNGREVDAAARAVIEAAGEGENFGHGLGHGVGMEIHEGPRLSRTASDEPLRPGNVVTVEPGVYLPGEMGVRIEDLVVVTEEGCEVLTRLPKELRVIS